MKSNAVRLLDIKPVARPVVKWAGGKGALLPQISEFYPKDLSSGKCKRYIEPFFGGGAVFFDIFANFNISDFVLIDINRDLISMYNVIKKLPNDLITELENLEKKFNMLPGKLMRPMIYKNIREEYNSKTSNDIRRAALIIFLNRTCFNGLYRVNSDGKFNTPIGRYENPRICDAENIFAVSDVLQSAEIICADFSIAERYMDKNTFVYYDPPYRPIKKTSVFNSYSQYVFDDKEQQRLQEFFVQMNTCGVLQMLSNSDPTNYSDDTFFDDLYNGFNINRITSKRRINSDPNGRGEIRELLITNY